MAVSDAIPTVTEGGAPATRPEHRSARRPSKDLRPLLYVAPALVLYAVFLLYPWVQSIWISFWAWDGIGASTWVGIDNYRQVFAEDELRDSFVNALKFILFYTVIPIGLGLVIATVMAARKRRGASVVQTIIFLPQILPLVAVGVVWKYIYSTDGPLNQVLTILGLGGYTTAWLGDFSFAFTAVGLVGTWVTTGLCAMLLFAGMTKVDNQIYEAAALDGASAWGTFRHITIPSLRRELVVAAMLTIITALASFDVVYVTTKGGPGTSTTVPGVSIYQLVFTANRVGTACALATALSVVILAIVLLLNRLERER